MRVENRFLVCNEKSVQANIFIMEKSCYIWLGEFGVTNPSMGPLITAIQTKYESFPISKALVTSEEEDIDESIGNGIGQRLSKKFGIQTFISYNLPTSFQSELLELEKHLISFCREFFSNVVSAA